MSRQSPRVRPPSAAAGTGATRGLFRRFVADAIRPYTGLQVRIGLCLLATVVFDLVDPLILKGLLDRGIAGRDRRALVVFSALLAGTFAVRTVFRLVTVWLYSYAGLRILFDMRQRLFTHALSLSPYFYRGERQGDILARLTADVDVLQQAAATTIVNAVRDILTIVAVVGLLVWLDPWLTLLLLAVYPFLYFGARRINHRLRTLGLAAREAYGGMFSFLDEHLGGVRLVQEYRRERAALRGYVHASRPVLDTNIRLSVWSAGQIALADIAATVALILVFFVGGERALAGSLSVGSLVAYYTLASRLFRPISGLIDVNVNLQVARGALLRLYSFLDEPRDLPEAAGAAAPELRTGALAFDDVTLRWPDGTCGLDRVSLAIEPGQVVALVGPSGSGKSTLAALAARYLDPTAGTVRLAGQDVRAWPLAALRETVGLVPQEALLFHDSLGANLRLARRGATEADLRAALDDAGLAEFVAALPEGLETTVGEQGLRLSGGERQRLALARALLKDPLVHLLDESTSALDPRTERRVVDRFLARAAGRTVVFVAHRLSSVTFADRIVVLDGGRVVEDGPHAALYAAGGLYRRLWDDQQRSVEAT